MVDQTLQFRTLTRLRTSLRPVAISAFNGSLKDLDRLCTRLRNLPGDEAQLLLPVFYEQLDPSRMPNSNELELAITTATRLPAIEGAVSSVAALCIIATTCRIPITSCPDIWTSLWSWLDFLQTYWDVLPGFQAYDQRSTCLDYSHLLLGLAEHPETSDAIYATPGVRKILTGAWIALLEGASAGSKPAWPHISKLLGSLSQGLKDGSNFEEVVDAFGSYTDLALAITKQISLAPMGPPRCLLMILGFLAETQEMPDTVQIALRSAGIVTSLVSALNALPAMPPSVVEQLALYTFYPLNRHMDAYPGYTWMAEALDAGLIPALAFLSKTATQSDQFYEALEYIVRMALPRGLAFYSVVKRMKNLTFQVQDAAAGAQATGSPLFELWGTVALLVEERVKTLDVWEGVGRYSPRACDNLACLKVDGRRKFRRCAACRSAVYCSPECQRTDWQDGHRDVCESLRSVRHGPDYPADIPVRERNFMRAMLEADYQRLRREVAFHTIFFLCKHPGEPFWMGFDYSLGTANVQCAPRSRLPVTGPLEAEVPMHWERLSRANGRMEMHVILVGYGKTDYTHVLPLRASSSFFHDGLERIARSIPPGSNPANHGVLVGPGVGALLAATANNFVEVH
ncbi:hypothetical protein C8R43DRAFT_975608 [Mycena crocata]|nr:hypothetical protein C8R43DRAFT_975608 [Mycena crocata]